MSAEYIRITPKMDSESVGSKRRIMCHAMIAYYENEDGENILVLQDGVPIEIWETPAQIDKQLQKHFHRRA
jgi:hypothetical protein